MVVIIDWVEVVDHLPPLNREGEVGYDQVDLVPLDHANLRIDGEIALAVCCNVVGYKITYKSVEICSVL